MNIAINCRFLLPKLEGIGWYTYEVVRRIVHQHPEHNYFLLFDRKHDPKFVFNQENCTPIEIFPPARHPILWRWWFEYSLPPILKKHKIDKFLSPDCYASLRSEVETTIICHDICWWRYPDHTPKNVYNYYSKWVPKYLNHSKKILTVSQHVKDDLIKFLNIPETKATVAHNGCKEMFKPISDEEKTTIRNKYSGGSEYFIFCGALHPRKNIHRLIEAFEKFKTKHKSNYKLVVVGNMSWQTEIIKNAHSNTKFKEDVIFTGHKNPDELAPLTAAASGMIYPSLDEGFGVPPLEAMVCDVPLATANVASMPEVAEEAAIYFDPWSVDEIADAMEKIAFDKKLRADLIAKGRIQRNKFSWDKSAEIIYNKLME